MLVADVDKDVGEYAESGIFTYGNRKTTLHHVLQESHCLQAYGLTPCVRSGNEQNASVAQGNIKRLHFLTMALEGLLKQRVVSLTQIDEWFFLNAGNDAIKGVGKTYYGAQIINVRKEVLRMQHRINMWANLG